MSNQMFVIALAVGAALLALWIDRRFPSLAPDDLKRLLVHTAVSLALLQLIPDSGGSVVFAFVVAFAAALPAFVYCFLVAVWLVRLGQGLSSALR